jgi:hypothetical protein
MKMVPFFHMKLASLLHIVELEIGVPELLIHFDFVFNDFFLVALIVLIH